MYSLRQEYKLPCRQSFRLGSQTGAVRGCRCILSSSGAADDRAGGPKYRTFRASNGTTSLPPPLDGSRRLRLAGHCVDRIQTQGRSLRTFTDTAWQRLVEVVLASGEPSERDERTVKVVADGTTSLCRTVKEILEWERIALLQAESPYPTGEDQVEAYWRTLSYGLHAGGRQLAEAEFKKWRETLHSPTVTQLLRVAESKPIEGEVLHEVLYLLRMSMLFSCLFWQMSKWTAGRTLGRTSAGYFL